MEPLGKWSNLKCVIYGIVGSNAARLQSKPWRHRLVRRCKQVLRTVVMLVVVMFDVCLSGLFRRDQAVVNGIEVLKVVEYRTYWIEIDQSLCGLGQCCVQLNFELAALPKTGAAFLVQDLLPRDRRPLACFGGCVIAWTILHPLRHTVAARVAQKYLDAHFTAAGDSLTENMIFSRRRCILHAAWRGCLYQQKRLVNVHTASTACSQTNRL